MLENDNVLRGHAAAFVKCAQISADCLRHGRVPRQASELDPDKNIEAQDRLLCLVHVNPGFLS